MSDQGNPNLDQQRQEWRDLRSQRGENPDDEAAFRQHEQAIGAPDPGEGGLAGAQGTASRGTPGATGNVAEEVKRGIGEVLGPRGAASREAPESREGDKQDVAENLKQGIGKLFVKEKGGGDTQR